MEPMSTIGVMSFSTLGALFGISVMLMVCCDGAEQKRVAVLGAARDVIGRHHAALRQACFPQPRSIQQLAGVCGRRSAP